MGFFHQNTPFLKYSTDTFFFLHRYRFIFLNPAGPQTRYVTSSCGKTACARNPDTKKPIPKVLLCCTATIAGKNRPTGTFQLTSQTRQGTFPAAFSRLLPMAQDPQTTLFTPGADKKWPAEHILQASSNHIRLTS
jgi:hypothetical protein